MTSNHSEYDLALIFADKYFCSLYYVVPVKRWFVWREKWDDDGKGRWVEDDDLTAFELVRKTCGDLARETGDARLGSYKFVKGVERLARCDQRITGLPYDLEGPGEPLPHEKRDDR